MGDGLGTMRAHWPSPGVVAMAVWHEMGDEDLVKRTRAGERDASESLRCPLMKSDPRAVLQRLGVRQQFEHGVGEPRVLDGAVGREVLAAAHLVHVDARQIHRDALAGHGGVAPRPVAGEIEAGVGREIGFDKPLMVAEHGAHNARPGARQAQIALGRTI